MAALLFDAFQFGRLKQSREGETAVAELERLARDTVDRSGVLRWTVQGGVSGGYPQLTLAVTGTVQLLCQRCLLPFAFEIDSESTLILARDEKSADEIDAALGDDAIEVIVGSNELNLIDLIEDEALLALPGSPRHEACPDVLKF
jgi:uncharacterized protein